MECEETKVNLNELKLIPQSKPCSQASLSDMSSLNDQSEHTDSPNDQKVPSKESPKLKVEKSDYKKDASKKENKSRKKRSRSRSRNHKRKRSRSRSKKRQDKKSRRSRSQHRHQRRSPKSKKSKKRSRSRHRKHKKAPLVIESIFQDKKMDKIIDKKRLLELAKVDNVEKTDPNFVNIFRAPDVPKTKLTFNKQDRSVDQFVAFCKNLTHDQNESVHSINLNQTKIEKENDLEILHQPVEQNVNSDSIEKNYPVSSGSKHRSMLHESSDTNSDSITVENSIEIKINPDEGKYQRVVDVKLLTPEQLEGEFKAWTKKDLWNSGNRMTSGIGKKLLEKMGWKEGEGLGKNREGPTEPIKLDIKLNRKGLEADGLVKETIQKQIEGKHPVSCLLELCRARKWADPVYEVVEESGPAHHKNFTMKVVLNGVCYQPPESSVNKKLAKAVAAFFCLQSLGIHSVIPS